MLFLVLEYLLLSNIPKVALSRKNEETARGPFFTSEPPHRVRFSNNTGIEMKCEAEGSPKPVVTWKTKDDAVVTEVQGLRYLRQDGMLVFSPFGSEDFKPEVHDTTYLCVASNEIGSVVSREVQVVAVIQKDYIPQVFDEFVIRGNTAILRCHIPSSVRDYVVVDSWTRNDGLILKRSLENKGVSYTLLQTGELIAHEITDKRHRWSYRCHTRNTLNGNIIVSPTSGKIIVTESHTTTLPRITFSQSGLKVEEGSTVFLPCVAQGYPPPNYIWRKTSTDGATPVSNDNRVTSGSGVLVIKGVVKTDSGKYQCIVKNSLGERRTEITFTVTAPLSVYVKPHRHQASIGESVSLNCTVSGYPIHTLIWKKNQQQITFNSRVKNPSREVLHITQVTKSDRGMYQCFAQNEYDIAQGTAELTIGEAAAVLIATFPEKAAEVSQKVSLRCVAAGNPSPEISWVVDDTALSQGSRVLRQDFVNSQGHVVSYVNISETRVEDGGEYRCEATNTVGTVGHSNRLNIYGPPFIRPMRNLSAISGKSLTIKCPYGGFPVDNITWKKDKMVLPLSHRHSDTKTGTLTIHEVHRDLDEGEYTCVVRNAEGQTAAGSTYVSVYVAPIINSVFFPERMSSNEGSRAKIICTVTTGDPPIRFQWLKNGFPFTAYGEVSVQVTEDSSIISFRRVTANDLGQYTCVASNKAASANRTMQLTVNVPPKWKLEPSNTSVILGHNVWIDCSAVGYPAPNIIWKKTTEEELVGSFIYVNSGLRFRQHSNGTLAVKNVEEADRGIYLCQAQNGIGAALSKAVHLKIFVPPKFEEYYQRTVATEGKSTTLVCAARGDQPILITWKKNNEDLFPNSELRYTAKVTSESQRTSSQLLISSLSRYDSALYNCAASNEHGADETSIELVVQGVPEPPVNVTVVNRTSRAVSLRWQISHNGNSRITGTAVQYQSISADRAAKISQLILSGSDTSATLRSLTPVTTYNIRVIAENALGKSQPSDAVNITTDVEAPEGPPTNIEVYSVGARSLKVMWDPPEKNVRHGEVKGYYVGYKLSGTTDTYQFKHIDITPDSEHVTTYLTSLQAFTRYDVVVQAYNQAGPGPQSEKIVGETLETAPPISPILNGEPTSASSIDLKWNRDASDMSIITEYTLFYKTDKGEWQERRFDGNTEQYTLDGLRCGTEYHMYMTATNSVGTGDPSSTVVIKTKGSPPKSPAINRFIKLNATHVVLHLSTWQTGGCPVLYYSVKQRLSYERHWTVVSEKIDSEQEFLEIGLLSLGQEYVIHVTAHSEAGITEGEYKFTSQGRDAGYSPALVSEGGVPFYKNMTLLLPVVLAVSLITILSLILIVCFRRRSRHRNNRREYPVRKPTDDTLIMTDICQRKNIKKGFDSSHYISSAHDHELDYKHEYIEPYSPCPLPLETVNKEDIKSPTDIKRNHHEGVYATIKRFPSRQVAYKEES